MNPSILMIRMYLTGVNDKEPNEMYVEEAEVPQVEKNLVGTWEEFL